MVRGEGQSPWRVRPLTPQGTRRTQCSHRVFSETPVWTVSSGVVSVFESDVWRTRDQKRVTDKSTPSCLVLPRIRGPELPFSEDSTERQEDGVTWTTSDPKELNTRGLGDGQTTYRLYGTLVDATSTVEREVGLQHPSLTTQVCHQGSPSSPEPVCRTPGPVSTGEGRTRNRNGGL